MRNLTIKREKRFVACLVKAKVYIEDHGSAELVINNTPCSKLGDLKNGEEKTFQISDDAAKVFVIADKFSKDYCNEFYQIPAGTEDVVLSGKNCFNPANGNAFRFNENNAPEVLANRKSGNRTGLIILIAAIIVGAIAGFLPTSGILSGGLGDEKVFSSDGMTITLTEDFEKADFDGYTVTYDSRFAAVFAIKESFAEAPVLSDYSIEEYADLLAEVNELTDAQIKKDGEHTYVEYDAETDSGETYRYFTYVYKADDAFWFVQFAVPAENAEKYAEDISAWAKSVTFGE